MDLEPELVLIPSGPFLMGSDNGEEDEIPLHMVHVDEFAIGVQPVTNAEYARFVRASGHRAPGLYELPLVVTASDESRAETFRQTSRRFAWPGGAPPRERLDHPVTLVRWDDAQAYCAWLSAEAGRTYRLPTEAEWEKAARGGLKAKRYPWGDQFDGRRASFLADPAERPRSGTAPCRMYAANGYGLFDAIGNVWEWVQDWYAPDVYTTTRRDNPRGPAEGRFRIVRGGAWLVADERMLTCSHRHKVPPDTYTYAIGFRVVTSG